MFPFRSSGVSLRKHVKCALKMPVSLRRAGAMLILLTGSILPLAGQRSASGHVLASSTISTDQAVERLQAENRRRALDLKHYSGTRTYHLEYHGLGSLSADMVVEAEYDAPATKRFRIVSEHGSKLILNRVFKGLLAAEQEAADPPMQRKTALSPENYQFQLVGEEAVGGRQCYVLTVAPRSDYKFLYRGKVWIDSQDFAVVQIEAEPAKNPSFWIRRTTVQHEYTKVGEFWLPAQNRSVSNIKVGGTATLTINYGHYSVSPGISFGFPSQPLPREFLLSLQNQLSRISGLFASLILRRQIWKSSS